MTNCRAGQISPVIFYVDCYLMNISFILKLLQVVNEHGITGRESLTIVRAVRAEGRTRGFVASKSQSHWKNITIACFFDICLL